MSGHHLEDLKTKTRVESEDGGKVRLHPRASSSQEGGQTTFVVRTHPMSCSSEQDEQPARQAQHSSDEEHGFAPGLALRPPTFAHPEQNADDREANTKRRQQERNAEEQPFHDEYLPSTEPQDDDLHHLWLRVS